MSVLTNALNAGRQLAEAIPYSIVALVARIAIASVFWRSALTKVDEYFMVKNTTFFLFKEEYKVPFIPHETAAYLATYQELFGSIFILLGLATRLTALSFIGMVFVIQTFVYPTGWPDHILWFGLLFLLFARGPGKISVDHLIWRGMKK
ncbi:MAG: DoxX family protein [Pseudomonadota bacterium]